MRDGGREGGFSNSKAKRKQMIVYLHAHVSGEVLNELWMWMVPKVVWKWKCVCVCVCECVRVCV